ncbi:transposase [Aliifodinibius sp. S!AR15-10]|uniref:transposase n=1 Tax=Aliifodinibius sp. S!AR15-10 TaxID=2950437 RepID=UPI0028639BFA|nr:transposase [Aliifodinibius sp. S!AR15-10]MDR8389948.1 transposase [Aliifodinibius sp. S!AR15-10]
MSKRRSYSKEFKLDVIQQSYQRDNIRELADELGIDPGLIYAWRSKYKQQPQQSFPGKGIPSRTPEKKELAELKKELADVRMERDILKKTMGIFTKKNG